MNEAERNEMDLYLNRRLDDTAQILKPYFKIGDRVLDVGCGPGSITLDVSRLVRPGSIVGFDHVEDRIQKARQLAEEMGCDNATFQCGDANRLPFGDGQFDVVYSHTVLHYFWDPQRALAEQARVLRSGGWLIAAGVRDWGLVNRYPACPQWDKVIQARINFCNGVADGSADYSWERRPCLAYTETGRRCAEWFSTLELGNLEIKIEPYKVEYAGAPEMKITPMDLLPWDFADSVGYNADYKSEYDAMMDQGYLQRETLQLAMEEAEAWFANPAAFHFYALIFIAGQKQA